MYFDRGHPRFRNFRSTVPFDVVMLKSYENCLFDPASVPVRITINKFNFILMFQNEHFSSPTITSSARINFDDNFLTTARNYFWPTTNSKEDAMLLAPVPEGKPKTQEFWVRGYTKHGNTLNTVTPPNLKKKSRLR